ncbi:MAG: SMI1/KNR4 family protein [Candidatus Sericytochromatia bacterium]
MDTSLEKFYELKEKVNFIKKYGYKFNDCLSEKKIQQFEKKFKVKLPEDYRNYLKIIGNGGDGPNEFDSSFFNHAQCIRPLKDTDPFSESSYYYDKRTSFRKISKKFLFTEDNEKNFLILNDKDIFKNSKNHFYQGCLILNHLGCGTYHLLEITGDNKGKVYFDEFARGIGLTVIGESFYDWFNNWVDEIIEVNNI